MAATKKFTLTRGDDEYILITLKDGDGNTINLIGATVFFTIKKLIDDLDDDALVALSQSTHIDAANGETSFLIGRTISDTLPIGCYPYDIQVVFSDETIDSTPVDYVYILADVTRRIV